MTVKKNYSLMLVSDSWEGDTPTHTYPSIILYLSSTHTNPSIILYLSFLLMKFIETFNACVGHYFSADKNFMVMMMIVTERLIWLGHRLVININMVLSFSIYLHWGVKRFLLTKFSTWQYSLPISASIEEVTEYVVYNEKPVYTFT